MDYHKNRAVSTKSFENTLISAGCKKRQGKLWQKREGWTVPALLTKSNLAIRFFKNRPFFKELSIDKSVSGL